MSFFNYFRQDSSSGNSTHAHEPLAQNDRDAEVDELEATFADVNDDELGPDPYSNNNNINNHNASRPPPFSASHHNDTTNNFNGNNNELPLPVTTSTSATTSSSSSSSSSPAPQYSLHDTATTPITTTTTTAANDAAANGESSTSSPSTSMPGRYDFESDPFSRPLTTRTRSRSLSARASLSASGPGAFLDHEDPSADHQHNDSLSNPSSGLASRLPSWVTRLNPIQWSRHRYESLRDSDGRIVIAGNDGVFTNLSAKPESRNRRNADNNNPEYVGGDDDEDGPSKEPPPTYDEASADAAPPYWENTIIAPSALGPDDILVDGLPVGNLFGFSWNLLVSMSFQFVGFLLTYVLHTSHAAKNGSRAGLGITLIQYGVYMQSRPNGSNDDNGQGFDGDDDFSSPTSDGTEPSLMTNATILANDDPSSTSDPSRKLGLANAWISYILMAMGWAIIVGSVINYWRAVRWARAVREQTSSPV